MLLKLFICKIDAELLKAVHCVVQINQLLECSGTNFQLLQCLEIKIFLKNKAKKSIPDIPSNNNNKSQESKTFEIAHQMHLITSKDSQYFC